MVEHTDMHLDVQSERILNSTKGFSEDECILSCVLTLNCTSSNYYTSTKHCDALSTDRFRDVDNFTTLTGATHFSIEVQYMQPDSLKSRIKIKDLSYLF